MFKFLIRGVVLAAAFAGGISQAGATVVYANSVISADSTGRTLNNSAISSDRLVASSALGAPGASTASSTGFYSLGFGGSITLGFSGLIGPGVATFYETTWDHTSYLESANIFLFDVASAGFVLAGSIDNQEAGSVDTLSFNGLCSLGCSSMKIVDTSSKANFKGINAADGFDVNAVSATLFQGVANHVPEPGTLALMSLGFAGLMAARRRKPAPAQAR